MRGTTLKLQFDNFSRHFRQFGAFLIFMVCTKIFGGSLGGGGGILKFPNIILINFLAISGNFGFLRFAPKNVGVPRGGGVGVGRGGFKNSKILF